MKIVDAFWEERNLGVTCYELELELSDSFKAVAAELDGLPERQYMVAKIPSARYDLVQLFQSRGYLFIETAIKLETNYRKLGYKPPKIPNRLQKICDKCSWEMMNESDLAQLSDEIKKNMFHTDRIYIDPKFTKEQAARRYDFWIKDLVNQGDIPYKVVLDNETIGFFVNKKISPKVSHGILGGVYTNHADTGMGVLYDYGAFMYNLESGIEKSVGSISGNNPKILRLHTLFGAEIKGLAYVFIKHTDQ